jgi:hypothetical protein
MRKCFLAAFLLIAFVSRGTSIKEILSPDGKIKVVVEAKDQLYYSVYYKNNVLLLPSLINMVWQNGTSLSSQLRVKKALARSNNSIIISPVPEKRMYIPDHYNELTIHFEQPISVVFRVYNDGIAYRFLSSSKDSIIVKEEIATFNFPADHLLYFPEVFKRDNADIYHTSFEEPYKIMPLDSVSKNNLSFTPVLIAPASGPKMVITESDLEDYPGMFISGNGNHSLSGHFAPYPLEEMVKFYYRVAQACADHKIMIMYHGAFKPAGFNRTYPNAITREGVLGSEYNIWSDKPTPEHNLLLPFIRMTAGSMDYEPGILDNATAKTFRPIAEKVMSIGTRCQQAAMFIVYESPMQIFAGNPSQGLLEPQFMELLGSILTTWDTTIVLDGKLGDYIVTARRKGDDWFIGAMTDWTPRDLNIKLDFLNGENYMAVICEDGINADKYASDYILSGRMVKKGEAINIRMAPGGGLVIRLRKQF